MVSNLGLGVNIGTMLMLFMHPVKKKDAALTAVATPPNSWLAGSGEAGVNSGNSQTRSVQ